MSAAKFDAMRAANRAMELWDRTSGPWATDAAGVSPKNERGFSDIHHPNAVSFSRTGAALRAIEEQVGRGKSINRLFVAVLKWMPERLPVDCAGAGR